MNTLRFMSWLLKLLRYDINSSSLFESFFQIKGICPDLFKAEGSVLQDSQTFRGDTWLQQQFNCNCILVSEVKIKRACEIAYVPTKLSLDQYTHTTCSQQLFDNNTTGNILPCKGSCRKQSQLKQDNSTNKITRA